MTLLTRSKTVIKRVKRKKKHMRKLGLGFRFTCSDYTLIIAHSYEIIKPLYGDLALVLGCRLCAHPRLPIQIVSPFYEHQGIEV